MEEYEEEMMGAFMERNFVLEDGEETLNANIARAEIIYKEMDQQVCQFVERLENGEVISYPDATYALQSMIMADRCHKEFQKMALELRK